MSYEQQGLLAMLILPALLLCMGVGIGWAFLGSNVLDWLKLLAPLLLLVGVFGGGIGLSYARSQFVQVRNETHSIVRSPSAQAGRSRPIGDHPGIVAIPLIAGVLCVAAFYGIQYLGADSARRPSILEEAARLSLFVGCFLGSVLGTILGVIGLSRKRQ